MASNMSNQANRVCVSIDAQTYMLHVQDHYYEDDKSTNGKMGVIYTTFRLAMTYISTSHDLPATSRGSLDYPFSRR